MFVFGVLGPVTVSRDRKPVAIAGARQRAVLALLLVHARETLSVERIVEEVWGSAPPPTATKMVRNTVSQLRTLLSGHVIVTHPGGYELAVDDDCIDARRFERLVREGREALSAGEPDVAAARLAEGLGLWRGAAFADVFDAPFAAAEGVRLEQVRLAAIEDRVEADLACGRLAELIGEIEALVAQYPLRERLRAQLMLALYRSGRQAEALEAYQDTRRFLVDELGIEPGRELQRLERAILVQDPSLDLEARPARAGPAAVASPREGQIREVRKTVSVLVAELVLLGRELDPEAARRPLARALDVAAEVLEQHGASVVRARTGGLTAVFGVPAVHEDDATRAVRAAARVRHDLGALNGELEVPAAVRIGVATGEVVVAEQEVVAGDAVERALRLQQATTADGILVDEQTKQLIGAVARARRVEVPPIHAELQPLQAWQVVEVVPVAAGEAARPHPPMVGREQELAELAHAFERTLRERRPYLFTVLGAAGIGKSRLAAEFTSELEVAATVLVGRCPPYGEALALWPLVEMLRQLDDDVGAAVANAVAGDPDGRRVADGVAGAIGVGRSEVAAEETFWAVRRLFEALARDRPLVLVFEDVHWAEPTLLDLVEHVAEHARDAPILLTCLARPELLETRPSWAGGKLNATTVLLEPLSDADAARLLAHLVHPARVRPEALARVRAAAEGNPLFLEQMLAMLRDDGDAEAALAVPPTIAAVLAARLDRVPAPDRAVLDAAAVIGREFSRDAVVELAPEELRPTVPEQLDALVRRELIWPHRSLFPGGDGFRFRHALVRDVAYESVPKAQRAELHARFADWLEQAAGVRMSGVDETVGHHLEQAHRYRAELAGPDERSRTLARRAAGHLGAAGRRAYGRGDLPAACALLARASSLLEPSDPDRVEFLVDLGDALRERGDMAAAEAALADAAAAVSLRGDDVLEAGVAVARLRLQLQTDADVKTEAVLGAAERAAAVFEAAGDERRLAKAWELLGWVPWFRCQAAAAEAAWLRALEYARRAGDRRTEAQSLNMLVGAIWFGPTPVADGIRRYREMLARPVEARRITASVLRALGGLQAMEGDFAAARAAIAETKAILDDLGLRVTSASTAETAAIIELLADDPVAAEGELRTGYERLEQMGDTTVTPVLAALLAQALYLQERYGEALAFSEASEAAAAADDISAHVQWRAARGKILARLGDAAEGEALARQAVALAERTDFLAVRADSLADLASALRSAGRPAEARAALTDALGLYERKGHAVAVRRARLALERDDLASRSDADR